MIPLRPHTCKFLLWQLFLFSLLLPFCSVQAQSLSELTGTGIPALAYGDHQWTELNADGYPDLIISGKDVSGKAHTQILLNKQDSTFSEVTFDIEALGNSVLDITDFNLDGRPDFIICGINDSGQYKCLLYRGQGNGLFSLEASPFRQLAFGDVIWSDLNLDGRPDLILTGIDEQGNKQTVIYRNTSGGFEEISTSLPDTSDGALVILDHNKDHFPDLVLSGLDHSGQIITGLYQNQGSFEFIPVSTSLESVAFSQMIILDYNLDGYKDLAYAGTNAANSKISRLYQNNEGNGFVQIPVPVDSVSKASLASGDMNNDGWPDLLLTGLNTQSEYVSKIYLNEAGSGFTFYNTGSPGIIYGKTSLADINRDQKNDLLLTGISDVSYISKLYGNDLSSANHPPAKPASLQSSPLADGSVTLAWEAATDAETPSSGLTYRLYIGSTQGQADILSAGADPATGTLQDYKPGISQCSRWLTGLPEGRYYWSVQTVDVAFSTSGFAPEESFVICDPVSLGTDQWICQGDTLKLQAGSAQDSVNWYSIQGSLLLAGSRQLNLPVQASDTLIVEVIKPLGCFRYDTLAVNMYPLPDLKLVADTAICYGQKQTIRLQTSANWSSINWYRQDSLIATNSLSIHLVFTEGQQLTARLTDENGCSNSDSLQIHILELPEVNLGPDRHICFADTLKLQAGKEGEQVNWYTEFSGLMKGNSPFFELPVHHDETVYAEVISATGCVQRDTLQVIVEALPELSLGKDTAVCYMENLMLSAGHQWQQVNWFTEKGDSIASGAELEITVLDSSAYIAQVINAAGCERYDTIRVEMAPLPEFSLGPDPLICYGDSVALSAGSGWQQVNWYSAENEFLLTGSSHYGFAVYQTQTIRAEVFNASGCLSYDTISVQMVPLPEAKAGTDHLICLGQSATLGTDNLTMPGMRYEWSPALGLDDPKSPYPIASPNTTTLYTLKVINTNGCTSMDSVLVQVNPPNRLNPGADSSICFGESIQLGGSPTAEGSVFDYRYQWYPAESLNDPESANPIASPKETTTYRLIVNTGDCYADTAQVTITVNPLPQVTSSGDVTISQSQQISLQASGAAHYLWFPQEGLSDPESDSPYASPKKTTTYTITGISEQGCSDTTSLTVFVNNQLFVPNLFTPNQDGQNDEFKIYGAGIKQLHFRLYDRWGRLLFESQSREEMLETGWNGTIKGRPLPEGRYFWVLEGEFYDGMPLRFNGKNSGSVSLVR
jgi:gliding motility-associated-like protein